MGGPRTTFEDPETGRWTRVCSRCKETKDLHREFPVAYPKRTGLGRWGYECKPCKHKTTKAIERRQKLDPVRGPQLRAMYARLSREWRARYPERVKEKNRRYREQVRKDPVRHARSLENVRIAYRLKAEQEGRVVKRHYTKVVRGNESLPRLPAKPLADFIDSIIARQRVNVAKDNGSFGLGGMSASAICESLGITERTLYRWRTAEVSTVQFDVADRVLVASDAHWMDVWPIEDWPEVHEVMAA